MGFGLRLVRQTSDVVASATSSDSAGAGFSGPRRLSESVLRDAGRLRGEGVKKLAKNTGDGYRRGEVRGRSQSQTPNGDWTKRDTATGRYMDGSKEPFKGVRREK